MPYPIASLSKRDIRPDVAAVLGDNWPLLTVGAGNAGGTTLVVPSLAGDPVAAIINKYVLLESGSDDSAYRIASGFAAATGTITVRRAYTAQVADAVSGHLHDFSPHLYTLGINEAIRTCYRALYRPILHHTFVRQPGTQRTLPLPRNMERAMRIMEDVRSSDRLRDYFDRVDSTTAPGDLWTASVGTWGISSESLYAPSDADGDRLLAATNPQVKNGVIQTVVQGTLNSAVTYRSPALLFRYEDSSNYLLLRLLAGAVQLHKMDGGADTTLTTATTATADGIDYVLRVMFNGSWIRVWIDDAEVLIHELTGGNLKYAGYDESGVGTYGNIGVRWDKAGLPATAARLRDYFCHELVGRTERGDWERSYDGRQIEMQTRHRGWPLTEGKMLWIEGMAELSQLTADTTFEALAADSTAAVELLKADPAYEVLVQWAAAVVLREAAQPGFTSNPDRRKEYLALAADQMARAQQVRSRKAMRYQARVWG